MSFLGRGRRRRKAAVFVAAGSLVAFQALAIIGAAPAFADTCSFTLATATVTVTQAADDSSSVGVGAGGSIELNDVAGSCGGATTSNTTTVSVIGSTGDEFFEIDQTDAGGAFPAGISFAWDGGANSVGPPVGEDEFEYEGVAGVDNITVGTAGLNIDADATLDVALASVEAWDFDLNDGADVFTAQGGGATGSAITSNLETSGGGDGVDAGSGNDTVTGGSGSDQLDGDSGDDTINGALGNDSDLFGDDGDDTIDGGAGNDDIDGGEGDDVILQGTATDGADDVFGGSGGPEVAGDTINYSGRTNVVTVDLDNVADDGESGETDNIHDDVENVIGGAGADSLTGSGSDNVLTGNAGNDALNGLGGSDTSSYAGATAAVTVDLAAGTATGGAGSDTLTSIENATGSAFADTLTGNADSNTIKGGDGDDLITGAAGADTLTGGGGNDRFDEGSASNGGDTLNGEGGLDWVNYGARTSSVTVDLPDATSGATAGACNDAPGEFSSGASGEGDCVVAENATLGTGDDTFLGDGFNNIVQPNGGQNVLGGGSGGDSLDYSVGYTAGVTIDLGGGGASTDAITDFENVTGTAFADAITGSAGNNLIKSGKGADRVRAGAGDDTVRAGGGNDNVRGGSGDDDLFGGAGNDSLSGGAGDDFCKGGPGKKDRIRGCESGRA